MEAFSRVLTVAKRGLRRQLLDFPPKSKIYVRSNSSISNSVLVGLLREPNSGVKTALDLEATRALKNDALFWEPLLTTLRSSSPEKAQLVLEWKLEKMLKDNERDHGQYSDLISLCGKVQNLPFAMHVFSSMEGHGVKPTSAVFNSLISVCLYSGNVTTALSLFEIMERSQDCKPNSVTYNTFISMYSNIGDERAMQSWYLARKASGFLPDVQTYESLISGCIKSRNFDTADKLYEEMMLSGITPNIPILENMLSRLCEHRNSRKIKEFLNFMLDGGWNISEKMAEKIVRLYIDLGGVEEMEELLETLMSCNQDVGVLSHVHCGIIIMYAFLNRLDDLEYSVGRMLKQGVSFTCPDVVEKVICSYFRQGAYERLDLFLERIQCSYKFTKSTYDLLVSGYRRGGLSEKLDLVMKDMKSAGFSV